MPPAPLLTLRRVLDAHERSAAASKRGAAASRGRFLPSRKGQESQQSKETTPIEGTGETATGQAALTRAEGEKATRHSKARGSL